MFPMLRAGAFSELVLAISQSRPLSLHTISRAKSSGVLFVVKSILVRLIACMTGFSSLAAHASCTNVAPSSVLDLAHWKLTLPIDAQGGTTGEAAEIATESLIGGYRSGYFCVEPSGAVKFWAPVDGATTDESGYPRSELRYVIDPDDDNVNWTAANDDAGLSAHLVVERVPSSTQKVVIGQIHGFQTNAFVKLRYLYDPATHTGSVAALVNEDPNASGSTSYGSIDGLANGQPFTYSIAVTDRVVTIKVNSHVLTSFHIQYGWLHVPMYFKAGTYDQASGSSSTDGGRVAFSQLSAWSHATTAADMIFVDGLE